MQGNMGQITRVRICPKRHVYRILDLRARLGLNR
jgi:hypothetical protein